jgi:hypothetical protein
VYVCVCVYKPKCEYVCEMTANSKGIKTEKNSVCAIDTDDYKYWLKIEEKWGKLAKF